MAIIKVEVLWIEETTEVAPMIEVVLIEGGKVEERSVVRSSRSSVASDVCELLHWLIGSSTLGTDGAFGQQAVTQESAGRGT